MNVNPQAALMLASRLRELGQMVRQTGDLGRAGDCDSGAAFIEGVVTSLVPQQSKETPAP